MREGRTISPRNERVQTRGQSPVMVRMSGRCPSTLWEFSASSLSFQGELSGSNGSPLPSGGNGRIGPQKKTGTARSTPGRVQVGARSGPGRGQVRARSLNRPFHSPRYFMTFSNLPLPCRPMRSVSPSACFFNFGLNFSAFSKASSALSGLPAASLITQRS